MEQPLNGLESLPGIKTVKYEAFTRRHQRPQFEALAFTRAYLGT